MERSVEERKLRMLYSKKVQMFGKFQTLYELRGDLSDAKARAKFLGLVVSLDKTRSEFAELLDEIILLQMELDEKYIPNHDLLDKVDEMCAAIRMAERALEDEKWVSSGGGQSLNGAAAPVVRGAVCRPKLELLHFSGDIREWEAFYELFSGSVHENPNFSSKDKFYYLMGSLQGMARNFCARLYKSGEKYEVVWNALVDKYQVTRALAKKYLNESLEWRDSREESEKGLISFLEKFDSPVRAFRKLKLRDMEDFVFLHHALARLNPETANRFEMSRHSGSVPQYDDLVEFIKLRIQTLAASKPKDLVKFKGSEDSQLKFTSRSFAVNKPGSNESVTRCEYCRKVGHSLSTCSGFLSLSPENRHLKIKELKLCYDCLGADHGVRGRPATNKCDTPRHLIHCERGVSKPANSLSWKKENEVVSLSRPRFRNAGTTLLGTAEVGIQGPLGILKKRFLLDSGSQLNLISRSLVSKLGLLTFHLPCSIHVFGGRSMPLNRGANFTVITKDKRSGSFPARASVVENVGTLPLSPVQLRNDSWLRNIPLADVNFNLPGQLEGVFGAEVFATILRSHHIKGDSEGLIAMDTSLGYVVIGRIRET